MNKNRICPKCGSNEIYVIDGYTGPYGSGNNVMIGATVFSAVKVNRYICCTCGFTEEWINREDLPKVRASKKAHR
ncbi:MAG: hypothetical protein IKT99_02435 [Oscillospiraceae bacterium]|jgi:ribosomal protein S27AE|nr:hypothetical protein [Oscillospiraceae bacterium]